jgi:hypothetical protein
MSKGLTGKMHIYAVKQQFGDSNSKVVQKTTIKKPHVQKQKNKKRKEIELYAQSS